MGHYSLPNSSALCFRFWVLLLLLVFFFFIILLFSESFFFVFLVVPMALSAFSFPAHVNSVTSLEHPQKFSLLSSHFLWRTDLLPQSLYKINQVCITHYILRNGSWSKLKSFSFHDGSAKFQSCFMVEVNIEKESTKILCLPFVFIFNFWSATLTLSLSLSIYIYIYIFEKKSIERNGCFLFCLDTCQEKGKWDLCITIRKRRVSFTETSNASLGHHKLSNSHEKSICQGQQLKPYVYFSYSWKDENTLPSYRIVFVHEPYLLVIILSI